jgi:hypothetical protein
LVSTFCGDGIRDPNNEECDDGPSPKGNLCNWACQVTDNWVQHTDATLKTGQRISRQLGRGSHPVSANANTFAVALVEQLFPNEDALVRLNTFDELGILSDSHVVSDGTWPADDADPVVAVLANGDVLTAYTEFGGDGDGLGIALRRLRAGRTQLDDVRYVSEPSFASQQHADILALSDGVVIAYTDESDASTGPQLRVREFDLSLNPRASRSLSGEAIVDGRVTLASIGGGWGAAWRALSNDNNNEDIKIYDASTSVSWTVGPHASGPAGEQPALTQLGQYHRLVLFGVGTDPDSDGISTTGRFHFAVLDTRSPGAPVREGTLERHSGYTPILAQGEVRPSLVSFGSDVYLAWQSGAVPGDANGEDAWFQHIVANITANSVDVTLNEETALPRWTTERKGDQRNPTLAILGPSAHYPTGALISVWDDFGKTLGTTSGEPDVLVQFSPLTLRRDSTPTQDCSTLTRCPSGKGRCTTDDQCQSGLVCSTVVGPNFGMAPGVGVCAAQNCVSSGKPVCGVSGCGTCHCGDGVVSSLLGEQCDDAGNSPNCDSDCTERSCGDGFTNSTAGESCDPGSVGNDSATCNRDCTSRICGDGKINTVGGETCDPGSVGTNTATCDNDCTAPLCGDNIVNTAANEACDPGSVGTNTATCDKDCTAVVCGDGLVNGAKGETCDPGSVGTNTATCDRDCTAPLCGDNIVNAAANEACDPGSVGANTSTCDRDCTAPVCGDNIVNSTAGEACDPGSIGTNTATCDRDCTAPLCGDNIVNAAANEACDPGSVGANTATCDRDCTAPVCGDNIVNSTAGEACDPGSVGTNTATCDKDCTAVVCGDGLVNGAKGETCDPGSVGTNTAACDRDCTAPLCGDNIVNAAANEACDPGVVGGDTPTCDKDCTAVSCGDGVRNVAAGEECDLGTTGNNSVDCMPNCKLPPSYSATGAYVVEGDMTFPSKTELSRYYSSNSTQGPMATLLLGGTAKSWNATDRINLSYCVSSSGFGSNYSAVLNAMSTAAAYWEQTANVHFEYLPAQDSTCTNSNSNVTFNVSADNTMNYNALSFFPGYPRANRQLIINYARSTGLGARTLTGVLVHQLGHVLGFIHDHVYCDSSLVPLPGTSSSCGTSTTDYSISLRDKWLTTALYGTATYRRGIYETRTDNATPVDWDAGYNKATATTGFGVVGLSQNGTPEWRGSAILSFPGLPGEFTGNQAALIINNLNDARRATRIGDWLAGYSKIECGANEYVSGISQATTSPYYTHAVRCSTTNVVNGFNESCEVRNASTGDSRGMTTSGDWDWNRIKGECSAGKVIVGVAVYGIGAEAARIGRPRAILCCGSSSRNSVAYNFEQRDAGFTDGTSWDGTYNKARCAPSYGVTGLSQLQDNSGSAAILCSPSSNGQYSEGASVVISNTSGDQRRYSRSGDWASGWIKLECGANEYISGISQSSTAPTALHAFRCTAGSLASNGLTGCETRTIATTDNRGTTATGDWSVGRTKYECTPGKVLVGISTSWALDPVPANRSKPHSILCCSR